ncbi:hypothetical protein NQ315_011937 [Exocentrus adspersus]|uniref:Uncharacterized protein n=1 Tax=Exocentrus adspersus TaxID=1586481 RepID=A0AAV8W2X9_9CUCU|nr:hypothetical protein NQ315_011937 [Exocentrus adspersus]
MDGDCKTAVVTGGTGEIGFAIAHKLLCNKGKKVVLIGNDTKKGSEVVDSLNCSFGRSKATFYKCDITNREEVEGTMKKAKNDLDEIDIVVNAAGVWNDVCWPNEMETNLGGTINVVLSARNHIKKGNGVVINLTGLSALEPFPNSPLFASFGAGVIHFTRSFGHDVNFRRFGVRVVALCLGITKTNLHVDLDKKMLTKEMGKGMSDFLKNACYQKPDACACAVAELVKYGPPGSVWVVEGSRLFYYDVPDYKECLNLVSQFM